MLIAWHGLAADQLHRAFDRDSAHFLRVLRDGRLHRSCRDGLARIVDRVEADDADPARPAGRLDRLDRTQRHHVVAGKQSVDLRVRLEHVPEDREALVALPIGRLRCDDGDPRSRSDRIAKSAQACVARLVAGNAFEERDSGRAAARVHQVLACDPAAFDVVRADIGVEPHALFGGRALVDLIVDDDHGDAGAVGLPNCRHDFFRARRADAQHRDARLDQVLDNLHLPFDVDLAFGGVHDEVDPGPRRGGLGAASHVEEERAVEGFEHERDARAPARRSTAGSGEEGSERQDRIAACHR